MLRIVLDTNIIISSLLSDRGAPARIIDGWRAAQFELAISAAILAELRTALSYTHIRGKQAVRDEVADTLMGLFERRALLVQGEIQVAGAIPEDASDEKFLACAIEAQADLIVSGDKHLLGLGTYQGIRIITARQLVDELHLE